MQHKKVYNKIMKSFIVLHQAGWYNNFLSFYTNFINKYIDFKLFYEQQLLINLVQ